MAIIDRSKKPFIVDRDELIFIGIDLPFRNSDSTEGYFASTTQTIDAVKQNVKLLLSTKKGERIFQPNLGLNIDRFLFEQYTDDTRLAIEDDIVSTFRFWLPYVVIKDLQINLGNLDAVGKNTINIYIEFSLSRDPNNLESVSVTIN